MMPFITFSKGYQWAGLGLCQAYSGPLALFFTLLSDASVVVWH